jgi:hypothetical protein
VAKRRVGSIFDKLGHSERYGLDHRRLANLLDGLLFSTIALIGFVLLWGTVWALTHGSSSLAALLPSGFDFTAPATGP